MNYLNKFGLNEVVCSHIKDEIGKKYDIFDY
jgi:hypothetical protein